MLYGHGVTKARARAKVDAALARALGPGEIPVFAGVIFNGILSPLAWVVVTNWRVLGLAEDGAAARCVDGADLGQHRLYKPLRIPGAVFSLQLTTRDGTVSTWGRPDTQDVPALDTALTQVRNAAPAATRPKAAEQAPRVTRADASWMPAGTLTPEGSAGPAGAQDEAAARDNGPAAGPGALPGGLPPRSTSHRADPAAGDLSNVARLRTGLQAQRSLLGTVTDKVLREVLRHANGDQVWFILGSGSAGALAAFDDRLLILKVGALTSYMAGSFGGGRITTLYFRDITGIEYNGGLLSGVLEVSTPAYQASQNKDYWRGTGKSRNADSNDPWTLSNTLPLSNTLHQQASSKLNDLRERISRSKQVTVTFTAPAIASAVVESSAADELAKLADLFAQGALSAQEFTQAKAAVLGRM